MTSTPPEDPPPTKVNATPPPTKIPPKTPHNNTLPVDVSAHIFVAKLSKTGTRINIDNAIG